MTPHEGLRWRKASRSSNGGGNCVEVADLQNWRKASRSNNTGGNCVEVAVAAPGHAVRDSKNPSGSVLRIDFDGLLTAVKSGQLDR